MADLPQWMPFELYQHQETDRALLVSVDGHDKHWIPVVFIKLDGALRGVKVKGEGDIWRGMFQVAGFKADECGFIVDDADPDGQGRLL